MAHSSKRTSALGAGLSALLLVASFAGPSTRAQEADRPLPPEPKVRAETKLVPQRQWEYRLMPCAPTSQATRERSDFPDKLNDLGRRGWELVGVVELQPGPGRECLLATFKREVVN